MTDFQKRIQSRFEKAAEQTLNERLGSVDWDNLPVKKMVKGTIIALIAWKLGIPAALGILRIIKWAFICLACFYLIVFCRWVTEQYDDARANKVQAAATMVGVDDPAPRAELVRPPHQ